MRMRHRLAVIGYLGSVAMCGQQDAFAEDTVTPQSGVIAVVTLSPSCPGPQRIGQVCVQPFIGAKFFVLDNRFKVVGLVTTNSRGEFHTAVPSGSYILRVDSSGPYPRCPDTQVTVPRQGFSSVNIECDTGIR